MVQHWHHAPACWEWPMPDDELLAQLTDDLHLLQLWQRGRCAICGVDDPKLVLDHDHVSGFVRGYLCRRCNSHEGQVKRSDNIYGKYRTRNPGTILGISETFGEGAVTRPMLDCIEEKLGKEIIDVERRAAKWGGRTEEVLAHYAGGLDFARSLIKSERRRFAEIDRRMSAQGGRGPIAMYAGPMRRQEIPEAPVGARAYVADVDQVYVRGDGEWLPEPYIETCERCITGRQCSGHGDPD